MCSARDVDTLICSEGMRAETALLVRLMRLLLALTWPRNGADRAESIKWLLAAAHRKRFSSGIPSNLCQRSNQSGGKAAGLAWKRCQSPATGIFVWLGLEKALPGKCVCVSVCLSVCAQHMREGRARMSTRQTGLSERVSRE